MRECLSRQGDDMHASCSRLMAQNARTTGCSPQGMVSHCIGWCMQAAVSAHTPARGQSVHRCTHAHINQIQCTPHWVEGHPNTLEPSHRAAHMVNADALHLMAPAATVCCSTEWETVSALKHTPQTRTGALLPSHFVVAQLYSHHNHLPGVPPCCHSPTGGTEPPTHPLTHTQIL